MNTTSAGPRSELRRPAGVATGTAKFADVAALTVATVLGAALVVAPAAHLLLPTIELPDPYADHHQTAETVAFLVTFAVILPVAVWRIPLLADRIAGESPAASAGTAALGCATLVAGLVFVRISTELPRGGGMPTLLAVMALWWTGVGVAVARFLVAGDAGLVERAGSRANEIWLATAALLLGAIAGFAIWGSVSPLVLAITVMVAALGLAAIRYRGPFEPMRLGWAADLTVAVLLLLAVPNLVILRPEVASESFLTMTIDMHQNFFVAPASDLLAGGQLLVDTFSQYGVVSIAFIAGWFDIVGVGNGMLGLLEGIMSALVFVTGYLVVRVSGVGRALAATGFAVAVVVLAFGLTYPVGALLQHGAIRFGMPMAILGATAVGLRLERLARAARIVAFATVGLSSVWALEAFGYTVFTYAAIVTAGAALMPAGERRRYAIRLGVPAAVACLIAHLVFVLATLAVAGELPDWSIYLSTLREFLSGRLGDLTYDFSSWSPGLGVGAAYLASTICVALLISRQRDLALKERTATILLAGSSAYGIALFSYLVNRSADHIVPYVSLPAFMLVMIWIALLGRAVGPGTQPVRVALALALGASALMVSAAWSSVGVRYPQSALAYVTPGGPSVGDALARLRDMPELNAGAKQAELLLDRYWEGRQESLVLTVPDLGIEALAQTGRRNLLPLSNPLESSFVAAQRLDRLNEALEEIELGELMLADEGALHKFEELQRNPDEMLRPGYDFDPLGPEVLRLRFSSGGLTLLQEYALGWLAQRFDTKIVARRGGGLFVVELVPRS